MYNDIPVYDNNQDDVVWEGRSGSAYNEGVGRDRSGSAGDGGRDSYGAAPKRANTWADDVYDPPSRTGTRRSNTGADDYEYQDTPFRAPSGRVGPGRPAAPKPAFAGKAGNLQKDQAVALFTFDADQPGDLGFKKGDVITVTKKTEKAEDWW
jgi:hypothetical protein